MSQKNFSSVFMPRSIPRCKSENFFLCKGSSPGLAETISQKILFLTWQYCDVYKTYLKQGNVLSVVFSSLVLVSVAEVQEHILEGWHFESLQQLRGTVLGQELSVPWVTRDMFDYHLALSVTRLSDFWHFGQLFKAFGNN